MGFPKKDIKQFFDVALAGESKTYNDHNWYTIGGLKGYIEGRNKNKYSKLDKPLSQYTIGQVKSFQSNSRFGAGQLWATGRYQIIPKTLLGLQNRLGLSDSQKYDQATQDAMGLDLLNERKSIKEYISGAVPDSIEALEKAALQMRKLEMESESALAEKRAQATPMRVDKLAKEKLQMQPATPAITHYVAYRDTTAAPAQVKP